MSDNLPYTFPYLYSTEFSVLLFIEKMEGQCSLNDSDVIYVFETIPGGICTSLERIGRSDNIAFSVRRFGATACSRSVIYDEICTMEIRNYDPKNMENCTVVLTGTDEQNEGFLNILISAFPSSDLMIKEPDE